eukprot:GHUV01053811.1.p2 GENE.GHUV01053811.1~~GHUV01053811.1.p2  ORF type:complete len:111 (-),score=1.39 GHUV01053811.1:276-608(-)
MQLWLQYNFSSTYGARVSLSHMFCFLSFCRRRLRRNRTKLVALMMLVAMATPRMNRHSAAAFSMNCKNKNQQCTQELESINCNRRMPARMESHDAAAFHINPPPKRTQNA